MATTQQANFMISTSDHLTQGLPEVLPTQTVQKEIDGKITVVDDGEELLP